MNKKYEQQLSLWEAQRRNNETFINSRMDKYVQYIHAMSPYMTMRMDKLHTHIIAWMKLKI